jgi:putative pyoverdin transport system ATP-binding/permease protein
MRLVLWLLRLSWRIVLPACLVGGVSGVASVGLVVLILRTLRAGDAASPALAGLFAALCLVVLATRIGSQLLLTWFTQNSISQLRQGDRGDHP